jgi:hypothetical protein
MERLMPLLKEALISGALAHVVRGRNDRNFAAFGLVLLGGFLVALASVFLSLACFHWLQGLYAPPVAGIACAALLLALSLALFLVGRALAGRAESAGARRSQEEIDRLVSLVTDELPQELIAPVKENPKTALALAAITGLLLGGKIR